MMTATAAAIQTSHTEQKVLVLQMLYKSEFNSRICTVWLLNTAEGLRSCSVLTFL